MVPHLPATEGVGTTPSRVTSHFASTPSHLSQREGPAPAANPINIYRPLPFLLACPRRLRATSTERAVTSSSAIHRWGRRNLTNTWLHPLLCLRVAYIRPQGSVIRRVSATAARLSCPLRRVPREEYFLIHTLMVTNIS